MPDMDSAPATAPAPPQGDAAVQSGGAGGAPNGTLPPSVSAPPSGANMHPAGEHAAGMQLMRMVMGIMHKARGLLDPMSEEAKAADQGFQKLRKHFIPDMQTPPMPGMGPGMQQQGQMAQPMRSPQGGSTMQMPPPNMPTGPAPMRPQ